MPKGSDHAQNLNGTGENCLAELLDSASPRGFEEPQPIKKAERAPTLGDLGWYRLPNVLNSGVLDEPLYKSVRIKVKTLVPRFSLPIVRTAPVVPNALGCDPETTISAISVQRR